METDNFNFRIMDEGKAPARRGILSAKQSLCKQKYGCDEEISDADSIVWQELLKELSMFENNISSQVFQATRIRCNRQRPVTSFLICF